MNTTLETVVKEAPISDEYRFPFSLLNACKKYNGVKRVGSVEEIMDSQLGRRVLRITGSVSANNYIEFRNLAMSGQFLYIQMKTLSKVATIHLDVIVNNGDSVKFSLSTLYADEQPRFLGRSLRLPLPVQSKWMVVSLNIDSILQRFCSSTSVLKLQYIKKIQICSSMLVRDVVTNSKLFSSEADHLPKELLAKSKADSNFVWFESYGRDITICDGMEAAGKDENSRVNTSTFEPQPQHKSKSSPAINRSAECLKVGLDQAKLNLSKKYDYPISEINIMETPSKSLSNRLMQLSNTGRSLTKLIHVSDAPKQDKVLSTEHTNFFTGDHITFLHGSMALYACGKSLIALDITSATESHSFINRSSGFWRLFDKSQATLSSSSMMSPLSDQFSPSKHSFPQCTLRGHTNPITLIEVSSNEKYLVTCENGANSKIIIWDVEEGKRMCTLQINQSSMCAAAFSPDCSMLATVGTDYQNRVQIVVWNINTLSQERKTIPLDNANDMLHKNITDSGRAMAKQLSDFPITSIAFSPYEDNCLVSSGRENIRFWRLRKKHLPGRPVLLGEFSRGFIFNNIAFYNAPGNDASDSRHPCVYFSSNKGVVLKVDYLKENIICAYHLHQASITSFIISKGFAITGANDNKLRVWPLDFTDYLMEAQHEGAVNCIKVNQDGTTVLVGTRSGTLGVLKLSEHSYKTVLRSHTKAIHQVAKRGHGEEFVTIGADRTIRIWDLFTCQQKYEFSSSSDEPKAVAYHPLLNNIACGFVSGFVRVFDVNSTSTILELKHHKSAVSIVLYISFNSSSIPYEGDLSTPFSSPRGQKFHLVTVCDEGIMVTYDADNNYEPLKSFSLPISTSFRLLRYSYNVDYNFLALSTGVSTSLLVLNMNDYSFVIKAGQVLVESQVQTIKKTSFLESPKSPLSLRKVAMDVFTDLNESIIKGLTFTKKNNFINLIIAQEMNLIQVPIIREFVDETLPHSMRNYFPGISSKKIDYGIIENLVHDASSGLTFLALSPTVDVIQPDHANKKVDLAIVGLKFGKSEMSMKICLSLPQLYHDHPGNVVDAIICPQHGKFVSVDDVGSLIIWNIKHDHIDKMSSQTPPNNDAISVNASAGTRHVKIDDNVDSHERLIDTLNITVLEDVDRTKFMMNDFENVVNHDPSMWSAGTIDTTTPNSFRMGERTFSNDSEEESVPSPTYAVKANIASENARLEDMFMNDDDLFLSPTRDKSYISDTHVHNNADHMEQYMIPEESQPRVDIPVQLHIQVHDSEEMIPLKLDSFNDQGFMNTNDVVLSKEFYDHNNTPLGSPLFAEHTTKNFDFSDSVPDKDPSFRFTSTMNSVPPIYNRQFREIVISDGSLVIVKNMDTLSDCPLPRCQNLLSANVGSVTCLQYSPSGSMIVAILEGEPNNQTTIDNYFIVAWARLASSSGLCWSCVCSVNMRAPIGCSIHGVSVAWANIADEEFLSLSTLLRSSSADAVDIVIDSSKMMISMIGSQQLRSGKVSDDVLRNTNFFPVVVSDADHTLEGSIIVSNLPSTIHGDLPQSCPRFGLVSWIGNKLYCFEVSYNESKFFYDLCWTDDYGSRGPIQHVSLASTCLTVSEIVVLDACGNVRIIIFHHILGIRSFTIALDTSHIGGIPCSVSISKIKEEIIWNAKLPKRVSQTLSKSTANSKYYLSQVIIAHRAELKVYSLVLKESVIGKSPSQTLDVKLHFMYSIKTANVKVDFVSLVDVGEVPKRCDRYHLPSSRMYAGQDSSIVSAWDIDILTSNKEGFIGVMSTKPSKYPSTPQDVIVSGVLQSSHVFPSITKAFVNFGDVKKYSAYLDNKMRLQIVDNTRKSKISLNAFDASMLKGVTSVAGCTSYLMIGTRKGYLVLFDSATAAPICQYSDTGSHDLTHGESIALSIDVSKPRKTLSESMNQTMLSDLPLSPDDMIMSIMFMNHDKSIITINAKSVASIYYIDARERSRDVVLQKFSIHSQLRAFDTSYNVRSFCCYGSPNIFALFYSYGSEIELMRARSTAYPNHDVASSLCVVTLLVDDVEIEIIEGHAIKESDATISIYVFGSKRGEESSYGIFKAEVLIPIPDTKQTINCTQIVYLQPHVQCIFSEGLCGVIESKNICVYDLMKGSYGSCCIYDLAIDDLMMRCDSFDNTLIAFEHIERRDKRIDSIQILFNDPASMIQCQLSTE